MVLPSKTVRVARRAPGRYSDLQVRGSGREQGDPALATPRVGERAWRQSRSTSSLITGLWAAEIPARRIAAADPLGLDGFFVDLPKLNQNGDVRTILARLYQVAPLVARTRSLDLWDAMAVMRDLGIVLSSVARHNGSLDGVPQAITDAVGALGHGVGMVERDTVVHYCLWNPHDHRMRTFTSHPSERALISCTAKSASCIEAAARKLLRLSLSRKTPAEPGYAEVCRQAAAEIRDAGRYVLLKGTGLDPHYFATELRHYFNPLVIRRCPVDAPAAAQVPLHLIDLLLWGETDSTDTDDVARFHRHLSAYGLPAWQHAHRVAAGATSLVGQLVRALTTSSANPDTHRAAAAILAIQNELVVFRGRHRRLVRAAYLTEHANYEAGSAGATADLIDALLRSSRRGAARLTACLGTTEDGSGEVGLCTT